MRAKKNMKIIVPTLYIGSAEPEDSKDYDIWYNGYSGEMRVKLPSGWVRTAIVRDTGYTEEEQEEMETEKEKDKKKIREIKDTYNKLMELLEGI